MSEAQKELRGRRTVRSTHLLPVTCTGDSRPYACPFTLSPTSAPSPSPDPATTSHSCSSSSVGTRCKRRRHARTCSPSRSSRWAEDNEDATSVRGETYASDRDFVVCSYFECCSLSLRLPILLAHLDTLCACLVSGGWVGSTMC